MSRSGGEEVNSMEKQQARERVLQMYDALPAQKKEEFDLMVQMVLSMLVTFFEISTHDNCTEQCKKSLNFSGEKKEVLSWKN